METEGKMNERIIIRLRKRVGAGWTDNGTAAGIL